MSKKRIAIIILAAWLAGSLITPVHHYGSPDSTYASANAGFYVEPTFLDGRYCGFEYYGVPGLFCTSDR